MDWGMQNRLSKIIQPDTNRTLMLAVDHGYFLGPTSGLENAGETIEPLLPYADCLMPTRGVLRTSVNPHTDIPVVLRVSGGQSIVGPALSNEGITVAIDDAIRLNVSGMALSIYVGTEHEHQTLTNLTKLVDEGEKYGIPVVAVTAVGRDMVRDVRYLGLCCRIAAELGAKLVKTYYCEGFEKIVESCPVPIVIAGGKKIPERDALQLAYDAVRRGATGVDMGRNIFQAEDPVAMIKAVRAIVHEDRTVKEAYELLNEAKYSKPATKVR